MKQKDSAKQRPAQARALGARGERPALTVCAMFGCRTVSPSSDSKQSGAKKRTLIRAHPEGTEVVTSWPGAERKIIDAGGLAEGRQAQPESVQCQNLRSEVVDTVTENKYGVLLGGGQGRGRLFSARDFVQATERNTRVPFCSVPPRSFLTSSELSCIIIRYVVEPTVIKF
jgi:hypothetical protein